MKDWPRSLLIILGVMIAMPFIYVMVAFVLAGLFILVDPLWWILVIFIVLIEWGLTKF